MRFPSPVLGALLSLCILAAPAVGANGPAKPHFAGPPRPPLPVLDTERAQRLHAAAGLPGQLPWQQEFLRQLGSTATQAADRREPRTATGDGAWSLLTSPRRAQASAVYDSRRDRMVVFGGNDGFVVTNDVWILTLGAAPRWTAVAATGSAPAARYNASAVYDSAGDRVVIFGGYDNFNAMSDVWELSLAGTPEWTELSPAGGPSARSGSAAIVDADDHRMIVFGGQDASAPAAPFGDVWSLALDGTPEWTELSPAGGPSARSQSGAVYDRTRDALVLFGGGEDPSNGAGLLDEVWSLSLGATPAWTEITPAGTVPSPRYGMVSFYDPIRDRALFFGGYDGNYLTEVVELALASPAWSTLAISGAAPTVRYGMSGVYDPSGDRLVLWGGGYNLSFSDVFAVDLSGAPVWSNVTPGGSPPGPRTLQSAVYDPVRERMLVFGGSGFDFDQQTYDDFNDVWALSLDGDPQWTRLTTAGTAPSKRGGASLVYDPFRDRLIVFGGFGLWDFSGEKNDVWALALTGTHTWTDLSPSGPPAARYAHSAIFDPVRDRMLVFGGLPRSNDVWSLSLSGAPEWSELFPTGTLPEVRGGHAAVYDPVRDRMVTFGGSGYGGPLNDVQALTLSNQLAWSAIAAIDPPSERDYATGVYEPGGDRLLIFGGEGNGGWTNDTWELSLAGTPTWTELAPDGQRPYPRFAHSAVYDAITGRMVVFAGTDFYRNDAWSLDLGAAFAPLSVEDAHALEGDAGTTPVTITVRLPWPALVPVRVDVDVLDGSATTADGDFVGGPGTIEIGVGSTSGSAAVAVSGDTRYEPNETFQVRLTNPRHATLARQNGNVLIVNDDPVEASIADAGKAEGNTATSTLSFAISLSGPIDQPVSLHYQTSDGTATLANADYASASGTAIVAPVPPAFLLKWGSGPSSLGLNEPIRVALDGDGHVYVADRYNHRIQKFDSNGNLLLKWGRNSGDGSPGSGDGEFNEPQGIALDAAGNVYVVDAGNHRIQKFDASGTLLRKWGRNRGDGTFGNGPGEFRSPIDVTVAPDGDVFVLDRLNQRVQRFDRNGNFVLAWGAIGSGDEDFLNPTGIASGDDAVFVADYDHHRIQKFDSFGNLLLKFGRNGGDGTSGTGNGEFNHPFDLAVDPSGVLFVTDRGNHRVQKFGAGGNYLGQWGAIGSANGLFSSPDGIAVDANGDIVVSDEQNHRIQKFRPATPGGSVAVTLNGDKQVESTEMFGLQLSAPVNATLADSSATGTITNDDSAPSATLTAPNGAESWQAGSHHNITWTASDDGAVASIDLAYSTDGGATFPNAIATGEANDGVYDWTVPATLSTTVRVRVTANDDGANATADASNANFTIAAAAPTNLVGNPGFETNLTGWSSVASATLTRVSGGHSGGWSMQLKSSSSNFGCDDNPNWITSVAGLGATYKFSAWVRSVANTGKVKIQVLEFLGTTQQGTTFSSTEVTLSTPWKQITANYVVRKAGTTLSMRVTDASSGQTYLLDDVAIELVSVPATYTLTASAGSGGSIAPAGVTTVISGASQTYTITPNLLYDVASVLVDGVSVGAVTSYSFGNVTANHTIGATFTPVVAGPNLVSNPGFETNTTGWTNYGSSTLTRVSGGHSGSWSLQLTSSSSSFGCDDNPDVVPTVAGVGRVYKFSAWVRSVAHRGLVKIRVYEYAGSSQVGSTFYSQEIPLTTGWQQLVANYVVRQASTKLSMRVTDASGNETFLVDDVAIELQPASAATIAQTDQADASLAALRFAAVMTPNPASGPALLRFATTRPGFLRVRLFDVTGREVWKPIDELDAAPGSRVLSVTRGASMEPGLYFYRIDAGEGSLTGRIVLLK